MQTLIKKQVVPLKSQVEEFFALITAFSNLLEKETVALKNADFQTVDRLQEGKRVFAKQYHLKVSALSERRADLPQLELSIRERLIKERTNFTILLNNNTRALEMAQNSTRRLIDHILKAARETLQAESGEKPNYSHTGRSKTYNSASDPLSLNQSL